MPATSILEQYRIADFLEWHDRGQLVLNPYFQRRSVWTPQAKVYLVDTVLRRLPIPKIYMRTQVDPRTRSSYREVVDGQQRLRAIVEFAVDKFALTRRANEYSGLRYSTLPEEIQEVFLTYPIAVDQLINASDTDVLEIFARLNSYTATLTAAEKRHARFQGSFKWAVHEASLRWAVLWEKYKIVSVRDRLRMADDSLMAEMFGVLLHGVTDGGARAIEALYNQYEEDFPYESEVTANLDEVLEFCIAQFGSLIEDTPLARGPQFLMLMAAVAHGLEGIPRGQLMALPDRSQALVDMDQARANLARLVSVFDMDSPPRKFQRFKTASSGSTQRIATRRVRFSYYFKALLPEPM